MRCQKRILEIRWQDRIPHSDILERIGDSQYKDASRWLRQTDPSKQLVREACLECTPPFSRLQAPLCA
ncbi:hypothetical protein DPMN_113607 [Dreissena polymorpha]|uniref:Uncharacterized protein n=1 Tax=Dreissena polymorpha TaxID=45954 RepID=A0A9D4QR58_DREPO|nr:hypothetical protein DPMN_113607 [Dreissena polymorpha]